MEKINKDLIIKRFYHMNQLLNVLKRYKEIPEQEFLQNIDIQLSTERALEICINICIDIGSHIVSLFDNMEFESYSDVFNILYQKKIISEKLKSKLIEMVKFRNFLGHIYMDIDINIVYEILERDLKDFYEFQEQIAKIL